MNPRLYYRYYIIFLCFSSVFIVSCSTDNADFERYLCTENIVVSDNNLKEQYLQIIGSIKNVDIVPLEMDSSVLFSGYPQTYVTSKYIYFFDSNQKKVNVFSISGKHLFEIASHGQGPEEYIQPSNISVSNNHKILIFDQARANILLYDGNGEFEKTQRIECAADKVVFLNDSIYLTFNKTATIFESNKDVIRIVDRNGKVKKSFMNLPERIQKSTLEPATGNFFSGLKDKQLILPWCNHIFAVTPDSVYCKYLIDFGTHNIPESFYENHKDMEHNFPKIFDEVSSHGWARSINFYQETNNHVFFQYLKKNAIWYVLFDKNSSTALTVGHRNLPTEWIVLLKPFLCSYDNRFFNMVPVRDLDLLLQFDWTGNALLSKVCQQFREYKANQGANLQDEDMVFLSFEMNK